MCRYNGSLEYLFKLPYKQGFKLIVKAVEKNNEEIIYQAYVDSGKINEMGYKEYKEKLEEQQNTEPKTSTQEVEDTFKKVEKILGGVF